jgi:hypothetical protein
MVGLGCPDDLRQEPLEHSEAAPGNGEGITVLSPTLRSKMRTPGPAEERRHERPRDSPQGPRDSPQVAS